MFLTYQAWVLWFAMACVALIGCTDTDPPVNARRVAERGELVGGPSALGEVGDFLLQNDHIRVVIQDKGFSRGFGIYGGSLIDIDLVRPTKAGTQAGGQGRDQFGELFPVAFLQALVPDTVEIINDGTDGQEAQVRVSGNGGDFLSLTKALNQAILNSHELPDYVLDALNVSNLNGAPKLGYDVTYGLLPDTRYVRITVRMKNVTDERPGCPDGWTCKAEGGTCEIDPDECGDITCGAKEQCVDGACIDRPKCGDTICASNAQCIDGTCVDLPLCPETIPIPSEAGDLALGALGVPSDAFQAPLGLVVLFGAGNKVFSPGAGYGVRFAMEDAYREGAGLPFPALPGLLTPGLVSTSDSGISYGLFAKPDPNTPNFVKNRLNENGENLYELAYGRPVTDDTMLVPFIASAFTGVFYAQTPNEFKPGESIQYTTYLVVGDGDAASVMDVAYELKGQSTGLLTGKVLDEQSLSPAPGASVMVYDADDRPVNQFLANDDGHIRGRLPAGQYSARVLRAPMLSKPVAFEMKEGDAEHIVLSVPTAGQIAVTVRDDAGQLLPAKITVVGTTPADKAGVDPRDYLFDMNAGQHWRTTDLIPDTADDPSTRQFIETIAYTEEGRAVLTIPPDTEWTLYISRGIEYSVERLKVTVKAGQVQQVSSTLTREVDTTGYISADFHLHAKPSLDSSLPLDERVLSVVGEGVEVLVSTDHNYVTDYAPTISDLALQNWATSMVGLELTTLESGHFNGYPLKRVPGAMTKGAFEWSLKPPDDIFDMLRQMGSLSPAETIVQINHPRDSILGYFSQYNLDPLTGGLPEPPDCTLPFNDLSGCVLPPNGPAFRTAEGQSTFSYNFDAIEVLNGSVTGQLHHQRMPTSLDGLNVPQEFRDNAPDPGTLLCDGGTLAYAGVADDWFNLLNLGYRHIGTGTSDSHDAEDHPGAGRTFVWVGDDHPQRVTEKTVVAGLKSHRAIMTSGPFVDFTVNDAVMGSDVSVPGGAVTIDIKVQAASWVHVNKGMIWANGQLLFEFPIRIENGRFSIVHTTVLPKDTWLTVEVRGSKSMFPIHRPVDIPPIMIGDALAAFAGPIGFGASELGDLEVQRIGHVVPEALTNPIWVDVDGDADGDGVLFEPPGNPPGECEGYGVVFEKSTRAFSEGVPSLMKPLPKLSDSFGFPRARGDILDVRTIFEQFGRHAH